MSTQALVLRNVRKTYREGGVMALDDVTFHVERGTSVAIMGPSGSGKSTLLNLIGGLDTPSAGSIVVGDVDIARLSEAERSRWRRSNVAFVFQAYHLLPTLSCAENVALPLHVLGLPRRKVEAEVAAALADVGLTARRAHVPDELSGGERQRVAIARAVVTNPPLLLADEPTGNLDSASGEQVLALLLAASRARRATLVMVTHNREAAARCDWIVQLRDGRLDETGAA